VSLNSAAKLINHFQLTTISELISSAASSAAAEAAAEKIYD